MLSFAREYLRNNSGMNHETIIDCSLLVFKFRNINVQYNDSANHLINGATQMCFDCSKSAFLERDSCYINLALHDYFKG